LYIDMPRLTRSDIEVRTTTRHRRPLHSNGL
jgi:hypothetical protein